MICKEDVVSWFKELESYKRIDTMCTLLNMCLPFELRFLGTCLEELGRRDSQELRGIELRVNNPQELATDIASCQSGEPTDMKIRRKMALYLALIRACNRPCVNELFKTLDGWGERDFCKFSDGDPLQELLLVYTMATNHPVFSFEQRMKCGEIFTKIKDSKPSVSMLANSGGGSNSCFQQQQLQHHQITNSIHTPPPGMQGIHHASQHQQSLPMHMLHHQTQMPMSFTQIIPSDPQMTVDGIPQMQLPPNMTLAHEFTIGPPNTLAWTLRHNLQQVVPGPSIDAISFPPAPPPQSNSPLLSQPSSPAHSRTTSPTRPSGGNSGGNNGGGSNNGSTSGNGGNTMQQQQHRSNAQRAISTTSRSSRRPSSETTPPPPQPSSGIINLVGNDMILQQNKNYDEMLNADALAQLQTICRNGYLRPTYTIPRQSTKSGHHIHHPHHQQHQSQQQMNNTGNNFNPCLTYALQNISLMDMHHVENNTGNRIKSGGSDSGSSVGSAGDFSPPDTPSLISNSTNSNVRIKDGYKHLQSQQLMNIGRINGRPDKLSAGTTLIYTPSANNPQQQQQGMYPVGSELIVSPNMMVNNNNNNSMNSNSGNGNNNVACTQVLMSGQIPGTSTIITTNPILLQQSQQHQQQQQQQHMSQGTQSHFTATYPYHAGQQHRPPLLTHATTIATAQQAPPPPLSSFRHHFQMQPNSEILYPYPPNAGVPATITFIPQQPTASIVAVPPPLPPTSTIRSSPSSQIPPPPPGIIQTGIPTYPLGATLSGGKMILSCFNCGSQSHTGRDCQESSMEDATRGAIYKLDYNAATIASAITNSSPSSSVSSSSSISSTTSSSSIVGANLNTMNSNNSSSNSNNSNTNSNIGSNQVVTTIDAPELAASPSPSPANLSNVSK